MSSSHYDLSESEEKLLIQLLIRDISEHTEHTESTECTSPPVSENSFSETKKKKSKKKKKKTKNGSKDKDTLDTSDRSYVVGSREFHHHVGSSIGPIMFIEDYNASLSSITYDMDEMSDRDLDFQAAFQPHEMRCLALVSHSKMKSTMKAFVIQYKSVLKKFRLTGRRSTMKMLKEVFADEPDVVFGPPCKSDADIMALMSNGKLGGIFCFQDPLTSRPQKCDIDCLVRQTLVNNILMANTPTSAIALMEVFKNALTGAGKPEIIPSFFFNLGSPSASKQRKKPKNLMNSHRGVSKVAPIPM